MALMTCEHPGCNETSGRDYKRKEAVKGWEGEPIYLCVLHATGFEAEPDQVTHVMNHESECHIQTFKQINNGNS